MNNELKNVKDNEGSEIRENCKESKVLHIGDNAPNFSAQTTFGKISLSDYEGKWVILFSHPSDFTPVCTTEFLSFSNMYPEFKKRNCELIGLSIDSTPSHLAWVNSIYKTTGIQVPFPIIADRDMQIAKKYAMISPNISNFETVRSVFFICPKQTIRAILQYPMTNGRNISEILRLLDSLQFTDKTGHSTPANWLPNQPGIIPPPKTYEELLKKQNNLSVFNCIDWYLCFNAPIQNDTLNTNLNFVNNTPNDIKCLNNLDNNVEN